MAMEKRKGKTIRTCCRVATLTVAAFLFAFSSHAQQRRPYHEDLSRLRPVFRPDSASVPVSRPDYVQATHTANKAVDAMLDSIDAFYLRNKVANGFTIQVYSGQKKQEALDAARQIQITTDLKPDVEFIQPKFRVIAGKYFTRVEAQRYLFILQKTFPDAIIIPVKIALDK